MRKSLEHGRATRALMYISAVLLALSYVIVALVQQDRNVYAAEVSSRSITMATSEPNAETTYTVQFDLATAGELGAIVVEFCNNNPLPNNTCTNTAVGDDVPEIDGTGAGSAVTLNQGSSTVGSTNGECNAANTDLVLDTITDGDRSLLVTCTATETMAGNETITLVFDNVDNPDNTTSTNNNDSFYARIYTYSTITPPDPVTNNPVLSTNQVDEGGVALSTAEQLTVTARVQEVLQFCVGTTDAASANDCTDISGNTVNMGIVDSGNIAYTPVATTSGGNNVRGLAMVRTNANSGVTIGYVVDLDTTGTNHTGALRVIGATCTADGTPSTSTVDQCFNSSGTTQSGFTAGTEEFGMTVSSIDTTNSATPTSNLSRNAEYDGDGVPSAEGCAAGVDEDCWAWDETGSYDQIASSSTVVDDEMLVLDFAATAAITTPTGSYSVTSSFIATPTF